MNPLTDLKLCYVSDNFAWFTSNFDKAWGDDWDDAPYEHNAGTPYGSHYDSDKKEVQHTLVKVAFESGHHNTPAAQSGYNSPWTVESINKGHVAWLIPSPWKCTPASVQPIFAGVSVTEFIKLIEDAGGDVYLPKAVVVALNNQ